MRGKFRTPEPWVKAYAKSFQDMQGSNVSVVSKEILPSGDGWAKITDDGYLFM